MSPQISIIVPVYNAEKYLRECLNSIKAQTFSNYEVLLIDDGSSDGSFRILNDYRIADNRFQLYQQSHRGVSAARNIGMKYATGEYICFVDADDQIAPTYLDDLYQAMDSGADCSMGGFKRIDLLSNEECEVVPMKKMETLEENLFGFYDANPKDWQRYMVNRMFKKSIIQQNNLRFREDIYYKEDGLFLIQYLCASNGMVSCVDKVLYYYYRNATGAMSKTWHTFDEKIITNLEAHRLIIEEIERKKVSEEILHKAKNQAKAACIWILKMMWQSKSFRFSRLKTVESIMVSILGLKEYLFWRATHIFRIFK